MGTRTAILLMDPAEGAYVNTLGKSAIMPHNDVSPLISMYLFTIGVAHTHLCVCMRVDMHSYVWCVCKQVRVCARGVCTQVSVSMLLHEGLAVSCLC